ncbi:hypothetical protein BDQ17DRAFT_1346454 [Cyathus striatus]|nr:hypothetical protein BDQ17DRAFT_1346454 [Cyathus striatus]
MGVAWIIGFAIYFRKRYQRKQRKRLAALGVPVPPKEKEAKDSSEERIIIPPDPAVLLGQHKPGEFAFLQPSHLDKHQGKTYHKDYHSAHATLSDTPYSAATAESSTGSQPILSKDTFNEKQSLGGDHNV